MGAFMAKEITVLFSAHKSQHIFANMSRLVPFKLIFSNCHLIRRWTDIDDQISVIG